MTLEYDPSDDSVTVWHDDLPPRQQCPKCGKYRSVSDFWRRPTLAEYTNSMGRIPATLPNPARLPPVGSRNCFICNGERRIKGKSDAELQRRADAGLVAQRRAAVELSKRKRQRERNLARRGTVRWNKVKALPWKHALERTRRHRAAIRSALRYYLATQPDNATTAFLEAHSTILEMGVIVALECAMRELRDADPDLTWEKFLPPPVWQSLRVAWATRVGAGGKLPKLPFILAQSYPSCLVFDGFEFPSDWRKVKTGGHMSASTEGEK